MTPALPIVFDCHLLNGEGSRWLRAAMQHQCYVGGHLVASAISALLLLLWGLGVAGGVLRYGGRRYLHLHKQPRFKFLFDGYAEDSKW